MSILILVNAKFNIVETREWLIKNVGEASSTSWFKGNGWELHYKKLKQVSIELTTDNLFSILITQAKFQ